MRVAPVKLARGAIGAFMLAAWFSPTFPQGLRIDLADPDPQLLGELPGITPEEVERLAAVGGLGAFDLEARLAASEIAPERLRSWIPYLELPAPSADFALRIRGRVERGPEGATRTLLDLGARGDRWEGKLRRSESLAPRASDRGPRHEGRLSFHFGEEIVALAGTFRPGTAGPDPWENPLGGGGSVQIATPDPVLATRAASTGFSIRAGGFGAAAARDARGERQVLLFWDRGALGLFWGRAEGEGAGAGVRGRLGGSLLAAVLHDPQGSGPLLRGLARSGGLTISGVWALSGADRVGRLDAALQGVRGGSRFRIGGSLHLMRRGEAGPGLLRASFSPRLASGSSPSSLLGITVQDRRIRLDLGAGRRVGGGELRLGLRLERRDERAGDDGAGKSSTRLGAGLCLGGRHGGPGGAIHASLLARTDAGSSFSAAGASDMRGRLGTLLGWTRTLPLGTASVRALLPLDIRSAHEVLRAAVLRFEIERHAGDSSRDRAHTTPPSGGLTDPPAMR